MAISAETPGARVSVRRSPRERFWNLPNAITTGRIASVPLMLLVPLFPGRVGSAVFGLGFLLASLSDLVDGYVARRDGTVTRIGELLDPLADKLLVLTSLVVLISMDRIPEWGLPLVVAILARETGVTGLRAMASSEGLVIAASSLGKWKTGFQIAAVTGLLLHYEWFGVSMHSLGLLLLVVATGITLWSGYAYFAAMLGADAPPDDGP